MKKRIASFLLLICAILPNPVYSADALISFSHRFHLDEVGASCLDCHANYKKPSMETCSQCHEGTGPDMPVVECLKCHLRLDYGGIAPHTAFYRMFQKQTEGICDRTDQVQQELTIKLNRPCNQVSDADLLTITKLDLSSKGIKKLRSGDFKGLSNLETLTLENNKLKKLPEGVFGGLSKLYFLSIGHNKIRSLDEKTFSGLNQLNTLFLAEMKLKKIPTRLFSALNHLENLNLRFNRLSKFSSGDLLGLPSLKRLFLEYNSLKKLPADFLKNSPKLEWIYFTHNSLRELPPGLFTDMKSLTSVRLGANRFSAKELERIKKELGGVSPTATIWTEL
ncbi:MAG: leucine-rich repeat protein [Bdellovibrio sp.]|nr:leucine-rich repeat protein [Bdellovibrio sp.]